MKLPSNSKKAEDTYSRLKAIGRELAKTIDCPLMREKIAVILTGKSVNH
jgi:hypothetical protein